MVEHFRNVTLINLSPDTTSREGVELYFERADNPPPPDRDVEKLRDDYEETLSVLRKMKVSDATFETLKKRLETGAQVGLRGTKYNVKAGRAALNSTQEEMIDVVSGDRSKYLWYLLGMGVGISMLTGFAAWFVFGNSSLSYLFDLIDSFKLVLTSWLLIHPGAALGVVFFGFVSNRTMTFNTVKRFDPYQFSPLLRFAYTVTVSYVLFVVLWLKWVRLGSGDHIIDLQTDIGAGFVIGLVCGISEGMVVKLLMRISQNSLQEQSSS